MVEVATKGLLSEAMGYISDEGADKKDVTLEVPNKRSDYSVKISHILRDQRNRLKKYLPQTKQSCS